MDYEEENWNLMVNFSMSILKAQKFSLHLLLIMIMIMIMSSVDNVKLINTR